MDQAENNSGGLAFYKYVKVREIAPPPLFFTRERKTVFTVFIVPFRFSFFLLVRLAAPVAAYFESLAIKELAREKKKTELTSLQV